MARHRVKDCRNYSRWTVQDFNPDGTHGSPTDVAGGWISGTFRTMDDIPTPGFKRIRNAGGIVMTPMSFYKCDSTCTVDCIVVGPHPVWGKRIINGSLSAALHNGVVAFDESQYAQLASRMGESCLISAYAKMNKSKLCSGEAVKDLHETVMMLRKPFSSSLDLLRRMVRRRDQLTSRQVVKNVLKASSDAWLENAYGFRPLIADMRGTMEQVWDISRKAFDGRIVARAGNSSGSSERKSFDLTTGSGLIPGLDHVSCNATASFSVVAGAGVIYNVVNRNAPELALQSLGLRGRDLPATLWECTPYSFVVDWFVNVGDWLNAVVPDPNIETHGNWVTTILRKENTTSNVTWYKNVSTSPATSYCGPGCGGTISHVWYSRSVNVSLPLHPMPATSLLSMSQAVSGLALGVQNIGQLLASLKH